MGILTEDLIEKEMVTCGSLFDVVKVDTPNTSVSRLGGIGYGLIPMMMGNPHQQDLKDLVGELPLISDSKHRLRIDKQTLIDFAIRCYAADIRKQLVICNIEVAVSSIPARNEIYYSICSNDPVVDSNDKPISSRLLQITLKERK